MKRYTQFLTEDPNGKWVTWEDHQAMMKLKDDFRQLEKIRLETEIQCLKIEIRGLKTPPTETSKGIIDKLEEIRCGIIDVENKINADFETSLPSMEIRNEIEGNR